MAIANVKIPSTTILRLKELTGEQTGQKAVETAIEHYLQSAKRRAIVSVLQNTEFRKGFDPLKLRSRDR